ncbi:hypothetical protein [Candidatus Berkiella aquae]|uniref:Uncharacterized protein n=1 Tax=Candidatus Berkiella aquae TaxID=295108 RepID=A0A0Q9YQ06_9GAMM|nr:hypothetical protein [Candidatus Berkiella aquae]MCS5711762.1 hypothetical protein [Candidatus Berkiella aquae]
MRELIVQETHQIAGGNFIQDIKDIYEDGLSGYALTAGILSLSTGMLVGSVIPKFAPVCAIGALIAYAIYDTQHVQNVA